MSNDHALGPVDASPPPDSAGGIPAMVSITKHLLDHMGPLEGLQALLKMNQDDGFDCPGCAWPDPRHRSRLEFCENGAKAVVDEATRHRVDPAFFARHSIEELSGWTDQALNKAGRITAPMVREPGASHYTPITWEAAFARMGERLQSLPSPDDAVFYTSGRTSNEAAFLYQLFVRAYGTNNLPDCSNMCHESSGRGMGDVIGVGKGSVLLEDFDKADLILVMGQNPGTNHPRMLSALQDAKRGGCTIVSINPLREPALVRFKHPKEVAGTIGSGTAISDLYLQVAIGGDIALLSGVFKYLFAIHPERDCLDRAFIDTHTAGFEAFEAHVAALSWDDITTQSGIDRGSIEKLGELVATHDRFITCWAMGLTQHEHGVGNIQSVVNLHLLRGALGKPGAGLCPVRGHSNVQGDRTMGIWERPSQALLDRIQAEFQFTPPQEHGLDVVHAIKAMHAGKVGFFFAMGGNFLSASPDTDFTADALRRSGMTVQVSTKLNRSHLVTGETALILPCLGRTERDEQPGGRQFVTVENSMGVVHTSRGSRPPASDHLLSEPRIVARLAEAALPETTIDWSGLGDDYSRIRAHISRVIPGFDDYNARVVQPGGFALPHPVRDKLEFPTPDGKAHFTVHPLPDMGLPEHGLWMFTVRSHDQYNTTIYSSNDRYRGIKGERYVIFMNVADMASRGLSEGDRVTLTSHFRGETRTAKGFRVVGFDVPEGSAATYFPEANVLVPVDSYAAKSHTPTSKAVAITVARG